MTAIILAGGLGTRLRSVINDLPKCMAPINGIPFLSYILKKMSKSGFKKIIIAVGYLNEIIISRFGTKFENIEIQYSIEQEPLGTGGAILKALSMVNDDYFFVLNGDTFFDINFSEMFTYKSNFLIASKEIDDVSRYGNLLIEKNLIIGFGEKGTKGKGSINGGIYLIKKSFIEKFPFPTKFSFENYFLEKNANSRMFNVFPSGTFFIDIGVPQDLELAQKLLIYE
jgi:D-glycero-alpha-D-manno-heptose 1-phosphate guanylyltransferase